MLFQIKDFSSLMTFMRYNDFENDPHAIVDGCEPERTPAGAIASRLDLSEPDSECAFSEYDYMVGHRGVVVFHGVTFGLTGPNCYIISG